MTYTEEEMAAAGIEAAEVVEAIEAQITSADQHVILSKLAGHLGKTEMEMIELMRANVNYNRAIIIMMGELSNGMSVIFKALDITPENVFEKMGEEEPSD